ncbi:MAG: hypothetical protein KH330_01245 [Clostridiales bacterium]|nr:hypothetical protein [Clostridiales bacterium]
MKEQDKERTYEDIINLPHHVSAVHPPMPLSDRAAQFAPFAALTGYGEVIKETARQTDRKPELTEDEKQALDYKLQIAVSLPGEKPVVTVTYFVPDGKKAGGSYHRIRGKIRKTDTDSGKLIMENGEQIELDLVVDIHIGST